jgi:hypothetical protein
MMQLVINVFFFVEYLPEDGRKRPKLIGGLPHVCTSMYLIIVQLLVYIYMVMQPLGLQQNFGFVLTAEHDPYFSSM